MNIVNVRITRSTTFLKSRVHLPILLRSTRNRIEHILYYFNLFNNSFKNLLYPFTATIIVGRDSIISVSELIDAVV